jgi:hypothetical protein
MTFSEKLAELGRTQLVADVENFWHRLFRANRMRGVRRALEKSHREALESELELRLSNVSDILQLPPSHPLVITAVIFTSQLERDRREKAEDEMPKSFIGQGWDGF